MPLPPSSNLDKRLGRLCAWGNKSSTGLCLRTKSRTHMIRLTSRQKAKFSISKQTEPRFQPDNRQRPICQWDILKFEPTSLPTIEWTWVWLYPSYYADACGYDIQVQLSLTPALVDKELPSPTFIPTSESLRDSKREGKKKKAYSKK